MKDELGCDPPRCNSPSLHHIQCFVNAQVCKFICIVALALYFTLNISPEEQESKNPDVIVARPRGQENTVKMAFGARGYHAISRYALVALNLAIFASSAIIVGILSYFINHWPDRGVHLVYQLVIVSQSPARDIGGFRDKRRICPGILHRNES